MYGLFLAVSSTASSSASIAASNVNTAVLDSEEHITHVNDLLQDFI